MATTQSAKEQQQAAAPTSEWWNPLSWFQSAASDWLGGIGGDIASGIEGGFVAFLKDVWMFILPFVEIGVGALIAMWVLGIYFAKEGIQLLNFATMGRGLTAAI